MQAVRGFAVHFCLKHKNEVEFKGTIEHCCFVSYTYNNNMNKTRIHYQTFVFVAKMFQASWTNRAVPVQCCTHTAVYK